MYLLNIEVTTQKPNKTKKTIDLFILMQYRNNRCQIPVSEVLIWAGKGVGSSMCPTLALCAGEGHISNN